VKRGGKKLSRAAPPIDVEHQKESPRRIVPRSGFVSVQLPFELKLTLEEYVSQQAWLSATLLSCPIDGGGCRPVGHGCYWRKYPQPMAVARFYCERARTTFSLLPDFLSSRYRGTLEEFEEVCASAASADCLDVANAVRPVETAPNISERSAERWVSRRIVLFRITLIALMGAFAERLEGVRTAVQLRHRLECVPALVALREIAAAQLVSLPPPLGFGPWPKASERHRRQRQHSMGPKPPASIR